MYGDTSAVDESFLAPLGVVRMALPIPFKEAGGPVNVYALRNADAKTWTLFDAGLSSPDALTALRAQAAEAGVDLRAVTRIIVSHGHIDHFGNAQQLAEESGARVLVHPGDREKLLHQDRYATMVLEHRPFFERLGVPGPLLDDATARTKGHRAYARAVDPHRLDPLEDGQRFAFQHFEGVVVHCPGHTPGLVCLHVPARKLLFADDHLLARVSPNPLIDLSQGEGETKFRALVRYLESARRVYALDLDCVLPGHGEAFVGHRSLLEGLFEFYAKRQLKLLTRLGTAPATVYELLETIFPRRDVSLLLLMLSEVLANVEVLESAGQVRRALVDGCYRFAPA